MERTELDKETLEQKFLRLAVIEQVKYHDIAENHNIPLDKCRGLWNELKSDREQLADTLRIWKSKSLQREIDFKEFKLWYEAPKACHYCDINEEQVKLLWGKYPELTKRNRGRRFEIDRKEPNGSYTLNNIVYACYWCNNAKTDTFSVEEFKQIGQAIKNVWQKRLAK